MVLAHGRLSSAQRAVLLYMHRGIQVIYHVIQLIPSSKGMARGFFGKMPLHYSDWWILLNAYSLPQEQWQHELNEIFTEIVEVMNSDAWNTCLGRRNNGIATVQFVYFSSNLCDMDSPSPKMDPNGGLRYMDPLNMTWFSICIYIYVYNVSSQGNIYHLSKTTNLPFNLHKKERTLSVNSPVRIEPAFPGSTLGNFPRENWGEFTATETTVTLTGKSRASFQIKRFRIVLSLFWGDISYIQVPFFGSC